MLLVTKNLAELCTLVIDDIYGELPSRIFAALLNHGRAGLSQLAHYTSLTPRQLRHGLAVLLQHDLLYFYVASADGATAYDASPQAAYNLLRVGKVLEMVETLHGADARDVVQSLLALGHTRIADLKDAYQAQIDKALAARGRSGTMNGTVDGTVDGTVNGTNGTANGTAIGTVNRTANGTTNGTSGTTNGVAHTNGDAHSEGDFNGLDDHLDDAGHDAPVPGLVIRSLDHLNSVLCRLVSAEVLEVVTTASFKIFADRYAEVCDRVSETYFPDGIRGLKKKEEYETRVADELAVLRDEPRKLKRTLQTNGSGGSRQKLRKLLNGDVTHGFQDDRDPPLDPKTVLRVNHDKCAVELRNQRLVQAAAAAIGETTAQVYAALLQQLTETIPRCRADRRMDLPGGEFDQPRIVHTGDVFDALSPAVDVFTGIGKAAPHDIDMATAEHIERHARVADTLVVGGDGGGGAGGEEEEDVDMDEDDYDSEGDDYAEATDETTNGAAAAAAAATGGGGGGGTTADPGGRNGKTTSRVKFDDSATTTTTTMTATATATTTTPPLSEEARLRQMRQHLLLLCDHQLGFARHCGRGMWTVDFGPLVRRLRETELDNAIERKAGRSGLRLARILRDKGKLDEKTLPTLALMKKSDVQNTMLEMQMHGFVDVQEVPRDNNRSASRTLFLWFCDPPRALDALLDATYKAMVRALRIRDVHRRANREVLQFVQRPDVKGREQEALEKKYFDKYQAYCATEQKLLGQVMRLDSLVATLRDY